MEAFLKSPEGTQITAVYAHNDDMALGAIQAIEEAGKQARQGHHHRLDRRRARRVRGDGGREAELHGRVQPAARPAALRRRREGRRAARRCRSGITVEEGVFDQSQAKEALPNRKY